MAHAPAIRIIGGSAGGRQLATLSNSAARPTQASVREALANILRPRLPGARVLDLYAGYGTVGLELLSCGAAAAVFVEQDQRRARLLRQNIEAVGFGDQSILRVESVGAALQRLEESFELIFADPPYGTGEAPKVLAKLADHPALLADGGLIIVQHATREPLAAVVGGLSRQRERRTGETTLAFYERATVTPPA